VPVEVLAPEGLTVPGVRVFGLLAAVAVLAGCGGGGGSGASAATCRLKARQVTEHAESMLLHYRGGTVYPADMSYLGLRGSLQRFRGGQCPEPTLGQALARRLTPKDREALLELLPRTTGRAIRQALAAA
jgi:hypothetical protein